MTETRTAAARSDGAHIARIRLELKKPAVNTRKERRGRHEECSWFSGGSGMGSGVAGGVRGGDDGSCVGTWNGLVFPGGVSGAAVCDSWFFSSQCGRDD